MKRSVYKKVDADDNAHHGAKASNTPESKGKEKSNSNGFGNGKTEIEIDDEETLEAYARILQDFGSFKASPAPVSFLISRAPAPTPADIQFPTIRVFIENEPTTSICYMALQRVSAEENPDFRPIFNPYTSSYTSHYTSRYTSPFTSPFTSPDTISPFTSPNTSPDINSPFTSLFTGSDTSLFTGLYARHTSPFPFGNRKLQFQLNNPFRINDILSILDDSTGNFTFFAPTDDAFETLFRIEPLLSDKLFFNDDFLPHLEDLLLYYGLEGERFISDFPNRAVPFRTFNNENLRIRARPGLPLLVNGSPVVNSDNTASNGVTHTIMNVLTPAWVNNAIFDLTNGNNNLSTMVTLLEMSGLDQLLENESSVLTFLAPTNLAFDALDGPVDLPFLLNPANRAVLTRILRYHIVEKVYTPPRLNATASVSTELGINVTVSVVDAPNPRIMFNQATATSESILANNGVLFVISAVLNPDSVGGF